MPRVAHRYVAHRYVPRVVHRTAFTAAGGGGLSERPGAQSEASAEARARVRRLQAAVARAEDDLGQQAALQADLYKLDIVVPSLLANIDEVKKYMPFYEARRAGYPNEYAVDVVEKDFKIMCKVVQEFRARVHTLNASGSTAEVLVSSSKASRVGTTWTANRALI